MIALSYEKNLNNAFEGSDLESYEASKCAEKLVRDGILYKKPQGKDKTSYSILTGTRMQGKLKIPRNHRNKTDSTLVREEPAKSIELTAAFKTMLC